MKRAKMISAVAIVGLWVMGVGSVHADVYTVQEGYGSSLASTGTTYYMAGGGVAAAPVVHTNRMVQGGVYGGVGNLMVSSVPAYAPAVYSSVPPTQPYMLTPGSMMRTVPLAVVR